MALPKRKVSRARRDSRRANWKLSLPGIVECPSLSFIFILRFKKKRMNIMDVGEGTRLLSCD